MCALKLSAVLLTTELPDLYKQVRALGDFCVLPEYADQVPFPKFDNPEHIPVEQTASERESNVRHSTCYWWNAAEAHPPRVIETKGLRHRYRMSRLDSEVIELVRFEELRLGITSLFIQMDDAVLQPDGTYVPPSCESSELFDFLKKWIRSRSLPGLVDRVYLSHRALESLRSMPNPSQWSRDLVAAADRKFASAGIKRGKPLGKRRSYEDSLALVAGVAGVVGLPESSATADCALIEAAPRPTLFRQALLDLALDRLTMPGLSVSRSELTNVTFAGSDLQRATWNWSEFRECDFGTCDLRDSDLRASEFEQCVFTGANLRKCDLRGASFENCDFAGADLAGAVILKSQDTKLRLSAAQHATVTWTDQYEEPPGG